MSAPLVVVFVIALWALFANVGLRHKVKKLNTAVRHLETRAETNYFKFAAILGYLEISLDRPGPMHSFTVTPWKLPTVTSSVGGAPPFRTTVAALSKSKATAKRAAKKKR